MRVLGGWMVVFVLLWAGSASALDWEMPAGRWVVEVEGASGSLTVDVRKGHELAFEWADTDPKATHDVVLFGKYTVSVTKFSDYHVGFAAESIRLVPRARSKLSDDSVRKAVEATIPGLETEFAAGSTYSFTFVFGHTDGNDWLQLCLHDEPVEDGGEPKVVCQEFREKGERFKSSGKPLDGSLINAPIQLPESGEIAPPDSD